MKGLKKEQTLVENLIRKLGQKDDRSIRECLGKLVAFQKTRLSSRVPSSSCEERLRGFRAWMRLNAPESFLGERFDFADGLEEGIGVLALLDLEKGQHFMSIPRKIMMTNSTARSSTTTLAALASDPLVLKTPSLLLVLHLLFEKRNPTSFWKAYLEVLPEDPVCLFDPAVPLDDLLQGSELLDKSRKLLHSTLMQYTYLFNKFLGMKMKEIPTWDEFRWAVTIVMSRQNRIPDVDGASELALIPGWDFCNYRVGDEITTYFHAERDASESFTIAPVKAGSQIFIFYGPRPNSELVLFSGFMVDSNPHDSILLNVSSLLPVEGDPISAIRSLFRTQRKLDKTELVLSLNDFESCELVIWLRIFVMEKSDAEFALRNPSACVWSPSCEKKALELLLRLIDEKMSLYPSFHQDEEDLKISQDSSRLYVEKLCVRLRISEKRLLKAIYSKSQELLNEL